MINIFRIKEIQHADLLGTCILEEYNYYSWKTRFINPHTIAIKHTKPNSSGEHDITYEKEYSLNKPTGPSIQPLLVVKAFLERQMAIDIGILDGTRSDAPQVEFKEILIKNTTDNTVWVGNTDIFTLDKTPTVSVPDYSTTWTVSTS